MSPAARLEFSGSLWHVVQYSHMETCFFTRGVNACISFSMGSLNQSPELFSLPGKCSGICHRPSGPHKTHF